MFDVTRDAAARLRVEIEFIGARRIRLRPAAALRNDREIRLRQIVEILLSAEILNDAGQDAFAEDGDRRIDAAVIVGRLAPIRPRQIAAGVVRNPKGARREIVKGAHIE